MELHEKVRQIKRQFFMMRNGMMGDQLRRAGSPYRIIFGLTLPQVSEIARGVTPERELAEWLWNNVTTRESLMIAPMVYPAAEMTEATARQWLSTAPTVEAVDILCLRQLRGRPWAEELACSLLDGGERSELMRYAGLRLLWGMLSEETAQRMLPIVQREQARGGQTAMTAQALLAQINMLLEDLEEE